MARTVKSTSYEVGLRQRRVEALLAEGLSTAEIAKTLQVSPEVIRRDIRILRRQRIASGDVEVQRQDPVSTLVIGADIWRRYVLRSARLRRRRLEARARRREALANPAEVAELLREERAEDQWELANDKGSIELLQTLGLIYREPVVVTFQHRLQEVLEKMQPEQLAALERMTEAEYEAWLSEHGLLPSAGGRALPPPGG
jgi:transposase